MSVPESSSELEVIKKPLDNGAVIDALLGERMALKGKGFGGVDVQIFRRTNGLVQVFIPQSGRLPFRFDLRDGAIVSAYDPHGLARELGFFDGPDKSLSHVLLGFSVDEEGSDAVNRLEVAAMESRMAEGEAARKAVRGAVEKAVPGLGDPGFNYRAHYI